MNYFKLFTDQKEVFMSLSPEECQVLLCAIFDFATEEKEPKLNGTLKALFTVFKLQILRDKDSYDKIVDRNTINGAKGGRPKLQNKPSGLLENPENPVGFLETQKSQDKDKDKDKDNRLASDDTSKKEFWNTHIVEVVSSLQVTDPEVIENARQRFVDKAKYLTVPSLKAFVKKQIELTPPREYADDIFKKMKLPKKI